MPLRILIVLAFVGFSSIPFAFAQAQPSFDPYLDTPTVAEIASADAGDGIDSNDSLDNKPELFDPLGSAARGEKGIAHTSRRTNDSGWIKHINDAYYSPSASGGDAGPEQGVRGPGSGGANSGAKVASVAAAGKTRQKNYQTMLRPKVSTLPLATASVNPRAVPSAQFNLGFPKAGPPSSGGPWRPTVGKAMLPPVSTSSVDLHVAD